MVTRRQVEQMRERLPVYRDLAISLVKDQELRRGQLGLLPESEWATHSRSEILANADLADADMVLSTLKRCYRLVLEVEAVINILTQPSVPWWVRLQKSWYERQRVHRAERYAARRKVAG